MRLAFPTIQKDSIVDGPGIRAVIWTQGCPHMCNGCHNPETWDKDSGYEVSLDDLKNQISELRNHDGITISGGEPILQSRATFVLAEHAKSLGLNVWYYTGYTFNELVMKSKGASVILDLFKVIDILVDGKFEESNKSLDLYYRGSTNQRVLNVKHSLEKGFPVWEEEFRAPKPVTSKYIKPNNLFL